MHIQRRLLLKLSSLFILPSSLPLVHADEKSASNIYLGQGTMAGEVTDQSALLQTRLTTTSILNEQGDIDGRHGFACFEWSTDEKFTNAQRTDVQQGSDQIDFIIRAKLAALQPNTVYYYRALFGSSKDSLQPGPTCMFSTLSGNTIDKPITFIVGSCMNYNKFMLGKKGNAKGAITATDEDKQLGFPAFASMLAMKPQFFVGTGDIVYYDNPVRVSKTIPELRKCWHEQFRFPRMRDFFKSVPAYWSKDDHDFRFNDSDNSSERLPLPQTGIATFNEQLPITEMGSKEPNYRTHRVSKKLQIWLTEGRDYRSLNKMEDGPEKTMWGAEQLAWLKKTLLASDATYKIIISPTPMIGPDDGYKTDNHANLKGFRYEATQFFAWLQENKLTDVVLVCGDRHWQYHSVHPCGLHEFSVGALNDENARMGVPPGHKKGSDPDATIKQLFTSPTPRGGFLRITVDKELALEHFTATGERLYGVTRA